MKIFLSHASYDKKRVRRLKKDLNSHGFGTWLDEDDILFGESITAAISKGLKDSDVLLLFLSQKAVDSNWVGREWQAKFFHELNDSKIVVVPVLLDDCDIPTLLIDLKYVDFREESKYETGLASLLRTLQRIKEAAGEPSSSDDPNTVLEYTRELLDELDEEFIALPFQRKVPIVDKLKRIPRSGKHIRLVSFKPSPKTRLSIRTVYDHVLSTAHVADCLLPHIEHGIPQQELAELARVIAFHELNEIVLGDIPTYTTLSENKRKSTKNYAESRLRSVEPAKRERIANEFIWLFLGEKQRASLEAVMSVLEDDSSSLHIAFKLLDKIDPILATWRYLHHYRGELGPTPRDFNRRMKDFYENPDVKHFVRDYAFEHRVQDLVRNLQDRSKAWEYYENPAKLFSNESLFSFPTAVVRSMIEGIPLFNT